MSPAASRVSLFMGTTLNEGQGAIQNDLGVGKSVQRLTQSWTEITHANPEDDLSVLWLKRRVFGMSSEKVIWGGMWFIVKISAKIGFPPSGTPAKEPQCDVM